MVKKLMYAILKNEVYFIMKRKLLVLSSSIFCLFFLTSCFDYLQSITYENGEYKITSRFTLSKTIFAMASAFDDDAEEPDYESITQDMEDTILEDAVITPINTDTDFGFSAAMSIKPDTQDEVRKKFLPLVSGNKYYLPIIFKNDNLDAADLENDEDAQAAALFLSTAKCRFLISKKVMPKLKNAYFENPKTGELIYFEVTDLYDMYYTEIPFMILYSDGIPDKLILSSE